MQIQVAFGVALTLLPFMSQIPAGESIASEGKGEYMYVSGRVLNLDVSEGLQSMLKYESAWYAELRTDSSISGPTHPELHHRDLGNGRRWLV